MVVFLDTNVILDVLQERHPHFNDSYKILELANNGKIKAYISATSVMDIIYLMSREIKGENKNEIIRTSMLKLLGFLKISEVTQRDIEKALMAKDFGDIEDALQIQCAKRINAEYIITRDKNGFKNSVISSITPKEAVEVFLNRTP